MNFGEHADRTLIVGGGTWMRGQKVEFGVCSLVLKLGSPIWKNTFGGDDLCNNKKVVEMPDDNPDAWLIVLRIAHFQSHELPTELKPSLLYELAVLAEKYDLVRVVAPYVKDKEWISCYNKETGDLQQCMFTMNTLFPSQNHGTIQHRLAMIVRYNRQTNTVYYTPMPGLKKVQARDTKANNTCKYQISLCKPCPLTVLISVYSLIFLISNKRTCSRFGRVCSVIS